MKTFRIEREKEAPVLVIFPSVDTVPQYHSLMKETFTLAQVSVNRIQGKNSMAGGTAEENMLNHL